MKIEDKMQYAKQHKDISNKPCLENSCKSNDYFLFLLNADICYL